jgi:hypothetical protein
MHIVYIVITLLAAVAHSYAAVLNFAGAESVNAVADRQPADPIVQVPHVGGLHHHYERRAA